MRIQAFQTLKKKKALKIKITGGDYGFQILSQTVKPDL